MKNKINSASCTHEITVQIFWGINEGDQFVMWMQQGRICILGKIEFSIDNENADKNAQVKLYFMPELKVILYLWKK